MNKYSAANKHLKALHEAGWTARTLAIVHGKGPDEPSATGSRPRVVKWVSTNTGARGQPSIDWDAKACAKRYTKQRKARHISLDFDDDEEEGDQGGDEDYDGRRGGSDEDGDSLAESAMQTLQPQRLLAEALACAT